MATLFDANRAVADTLLQQLEEESGGGAIRCRDTTETACISQIIVTRPDTRSAALVQVNLLYAAHGRERPVVVLDEDDPWFDAFSDEFDHIWTRSLER